MARVLTNNTALDNDVALFPLRWQAGASSFSGGGLGAEHTQFFLEGVPLLPHGSNPHFPLASLLPLVDAGPVLIHAGD